ncbi:hypothetical protein V2J09_021625 [Rumex salicifolius]
MNHYFFLFRRAAIRNTSTRFPNRAGQSALTRQFSTSSDPDDELPGSWRSMEGLLKCSANYVPLTPLTFLDRSALVFPDRTSLVHGSLRFTWAQTRQRCVRLAAALSRLGISKGDVVSTLAPNIPSVYELHFAASMAGAILNTLNTRLDAAMISVLLSHSEAKAIFVDQTLLDLAHGALDLLSKNGGKKPLIILIHDAEFDESERANHSLYDYEYEDLVANGDNEFHIKRPTDEWDPISLNYTSGTTSRPKGVVYSHRGAYLNAIATFMLHGMTSLPTYLWTVPMFHCNGWCLPWGVAALSGTNICTRKVVPKEIFDNIVKHNVTDMGGAPTVLNMIVNSPDQRPLPHKVRVVTGGSPPPPQILFKMESLGFEIIHIYGLTETHGPGTYCIWKPEWDSLPPQERSVLKARQGMQNLAMEDVEVKDPETMESVPSDGKTIGEIMFRGNIVMSGYYKDKKATEEAFNGGWFRTGDLAVKHPDGYLQVKDRSKDIIISGGENISTAEVERVMYDHPAVLEVAVVARPDNHWGQTPCAFVVLKDGFDGVDEKQIIEYCREHLPHYMCPKTVVFDELPKTSTGKIQKFVLREKAKALGSLT